MLMVVSKYFVMYTTERDIVDKVESIRVVAHRTEKWRKAAKCKLRALITGKYRWVLFYASVARDQRVSSQMLTC